MEEKIPFYSVAESDPKSKHCFHRECLLTWFDTSKSNKCPLCRGEADDEHFSSLETQLAHFCSFSSKHPFIKYNIYEAVKNCSPKVINENLTKCLRLGYFKKAVKIFNCINSIVQEFPVSESPNIELFETLPRYIVLCGDVRVRFIRPLFIPSVARAHKADLLTKSDKILLKLLNYDLEKLDKNKDLHCWNEVFETYKRNEIYAALGSLDTGQFHFQIFTEDKLVDESGIFSPTGN